MQIRRFIPLAAILLGVASVPPAAAQPSLLGASDAFLEELASLDLDGLTPLQAIIKLCELREKAHGKQG
jgi:hypothetical protein